ncbi:intraflagellar transport protein 46 homolog [Onthophagus taurus]|uniref:intraflagellar transport protein 46 homolog n=1 Tax=Onthophagus taurus TaxID=166361 RepID=UPI0039BDA5DF
MQRQHSFSILNDSKKSSKKNNQKESLSDFLSDSEEEISIETPGKVPQIPDVTDALSHVNGIRQKITSAGPSSDRKSSNLSSDSDSESDEKKKNLPGEYDPKNFDDLDVNEEVRDLFQFIIKYTPQNLNLDFKFKPFIPDYIPAVGDIDAFIKVVPPQQGIDDDEKNGIKTDHLGLTVLDEPSAAQSDPALLHLQLRASSVNSQTDQKDIVVKSVENVEKNVKVIDKWIKDMNDLHKSKSSPVVRYSDPMPDLDDLMEQWPENIDNLIKIQGIPHFSAFETLTEYIDVICCIFDIPVYQNRLGSLHLFFSLCAAVKNSQIYQSSVYNETFSDNKTINGESDQLVLD